MARNVWAQMRYGALTTFVAPLVPAVLKKRRKTGKEHPTRWREKLGQAGQARPHGPLVWLHGVGLGEVLSARAVIDAMSARRPDLHFLVTSSTRVSADVFETQKPDQVVHQFLPFDTPFAVRRFLDHWHPDAALWIEQDIWPGLVFGCQRRHIPSALINGRLHNAAAAKRAKAKGLYKAVYGAFDLVAAQDAPSAQNLSRFRGLPVPHYPNLKSISPPLKAAPHILQAWKKRLGARRIWAAGSAHMADAKAALAAHCMLMKADPNAVLALLPRYAADAAPIEALALDMKLSVARCTDETPASVLIEDRFGQTGLWYALADAALIGGGFDDTGGHNPWEAVHLDCDVLFGPNTENFADDCAALSDHGAAAQAADAAQIAARLMKPNSDERAKHRAAALNAQRALLRPLLDDVIQLLEQRLGANGASKLPQR